MHMISPVERNVNESPADSLQIPHALQHRFGLSERPVARTLDSSIMV